MEACLRLSIPQLKTCMIHLPLSTIDQLFAMAHVTQQPWSPDIGRVLVSVKLGAPVPTGLETAFPDMFTDGSSESKNFFTFAVYFFTFRKDEEKLCYVPGQWHLQEMGTSKRLSVHQDPDDSTDSPSARDLWMSLTKKWGKTRASTLDLSSFADLDEPIPESQANDNDAEDLDVDLEWSCLKSAARKELFNSDPGESADEAIAKEIAGVLQIAMAGIVEEQGGFSLLHSAEGALPGARSFSRFLRAVDKRTDMIER